MYIYIYIFVLYMCVFLNAADVFDKNRHHCIYMYIYIYIYLFCICMYVFLNAAYAYQLSKWSTTKTHLLMHTVFLSPDEPVDNVVVSTLQS